MWYAGTMQDPLTVVRQEGLLLLTPAEPQLQEDAWLSLCPTCWVPILLLSLLTAVSSPISAPVVFSGLGQEEQVHHELWCGTFAWGHHLHEGRELKVNCGAKCRSLL